MNQTDKHVPGFAVGETMRMPAAISVQQFKQREVFNAVYRNVEQLRANLDSKLLNEFIGNVNE